MNVSFHLLSASSISLMTNKDGVAGAFFYVGTTNCIQQMPVANQRFQAACNSTQVMVFSNLAIQTKRKAPNAHSKILELGILSSLKYFPAFLEIMRVRYGTFVHLSFMVRILVAVAIHLLNLITQFFSLAANTVRIFIAPPY